VIKDPPSMSDVMSRCDMAVTAAGSTVYELAALGVPSLLIPQADNQKRLAEYLSSNNMMKSLGWWEDIDADALLKEVQDLLYNTERRACESDRLKQSVNENGARRLASDILRIMDETFGKNQ
jgi:spore coat polysaccharide biosynthesis predicted glycosyltransferase SpsG